LDLTDPQARQEYFDNFVGGAVLGGAISVPGHYYDKNVEQPRQAKLLALQQQAEERKKQLEEQQRQQQQLQQTYQNLNVPQTTNLLPAPEKAAPVPDKNLAPAIQQDMLQNYNGNFNQQTIDNVFGQGAFDRINDVREFDHGKPRLNQMSIEDLAHAGANPEDLSRLLTVQHDYTNVKEKNFAPAQILKMAEKKGIETGTGGFNSFLMRTTGTDNLQDMTYAQRHAVAKALDSVPVNEGAKTILPEGQTNATPWHPADYDDAVKAVQADLAENKELSQADIMKTIHNATFLGQGTAPRAEDAKMLLDEMVRRGDVSLNIRPDKSSTPDNPKYLQTVIPAHPMANTPAGMDVRREVLGEGRGRREVFSLYENGERMGSFPTKQEAEEHGMSRLHDDILKQTITAAPHQLLPNGEIHPLARRYAEMAKNELNERQGISRDFRGITTSQGLEGANERLAKLGIFNEKVQELAPEIKKDLEKRLRQYGLANVAVRMMDSIANGAANAAYHASLIEMAVDAEDPMGELDHESIHALIDLGAFRPDELRVLENKAKSEWLQKYIKDTGKYDLYKKQYESEGRDMKTFEADMLEESVAEAFKHFNKQQPPAGMVGSLFKRISKFFEAVKNAFNGAGFKTADDIFEGITRGKFTPTVEGTTNEKRSLRQYNPDGSPKSEVRPSGRGNEGIAGLGDRGRGQAPRSLAPLEGAPLVQGATGPDPRIVNVAKQYAEANGIPYERQQSYVGVDEDRSNRIAQAYENMQHTPNDPKVKAAYKDLIRQTKNQYKALVNAGYKFSFFDSKTDPYDGNPWNAMRDLRNNKRMAVYGSYDGFGTEGITDKASKNNLMLEKTGLRWKDQNGVMHPVTVNDLFRAVHDAFGHGLEGAGFRAQGEENAWQAHAKMFTGPALGALTSETRGQNSWLNFGPYAERNRSAKVEDTVFADQKIGLMPDWTWKEGLHNAGISLGKQQKGAASYEAIHYSNEPRKTLNGSAYGKGIRGAEANRLAQSDDPRIQKRAYFYIPNESGRYNFPETGVGNQAHKQTFKNILPPGTEAQRLNAEANGNPNKFESLVVDAGYDGYAVPNMGMMVILNHDNIPVEPRGTRLEMQDRGEKYSLKIPDTQEFKRWYFSQLEQKIEESPDRIFNKAPQIKAWLTSNAPKLGVKSEELQFSGINDWLDLQGDKKVLKEDVLNYLKQGGVQLEEVKKSENKNETRYEDYQLDGGSNYQEMLLTLPSQLPDGWSVKELNMTNKASSVKPFEVYDGDELIGMGDSRQDAIDDAFRRKGLKGINVERPNEFRSSHFQAPNILAHIRMNDRKDPNGNKVLFIEEIQSDWHQAGRKRGYEEPIPQNLSPSDLLWEYGPKLSEKQKNNLRDFIERYELGNIDTLVNEDLISREQYTQLMDLARKSLDDEYKNWLKNQKTIGVPNAPFKDTKAWTGLALKRIIAYAAENGYDKVAFINGDQSADRYDLSKQISQLSVQRNATNFTINALDRDGHPAIYKSVPTLIDLDELVGKDLAEKIKNDFANKSGDKHEYSGLDLKVGGKGMIDYYNNILPQVAKDVLRKIDGGNLEKVTVPVRIMVPSNVEFKYTVVSDLLNDNAYVIDNKTGERATETMSYDEAKDWLRSHDPATTGQQNGFSITDKIRDKVSKGLPLFSLRDSNFSLNNAPPQSLTTLEKQESAGERLNNTIRDVKDAAQDQEFWTGLRNNWVDKGSGLTKTLQNQEVYKDGVLRADLLSRAYSQVINLVKNGLQSGIPIINNDGSIIIKSDAVNNLANSHIIADKLDDNAQVKASGLSGRGFVAEVARAMRGKEILEEDARLGLKRELQVTPAQIAWAEQQIKNVPELNQIFSIWKNVNTALVNLWEAAGLLDKAEADSYRAKKHYVSLAASKADLEEMINNQYTSNAPGLKSTKKIFKLEGSELDRNIWENVDKQYAAMLTAAYQNHIRKTAVDQLRSIGMATTSRINEKGNEVPLYRGDPNINLRYKENGKIVDAIVHNQTDLAAFEAMHYELNPIMKFMAGSTKLLRAGALLNPMFWLRQLIKDPIHANLVANSGIVTPFHSAGEFMRILMKDSEEAKLLAERGVIGQYDSTIDIYDYLNQVGKEKSKPSTLDKALHKMMQVHEASDAATRVAIFKKEKASALAKGMTEADATNFAVMKARESINFALHGNSKTLFYARHMIPFLSASITSLDTVYRAATGYGLPPAERAAARKLFKQRAFMMAAMCTAYAMLMQNDDDYKKLPDYVKDNNWLIKNPTGDGFIKIPTPFEVGFLFKTIPEASVRYMSGTSTGKEVLHSYWEGVTNNLPGNALPIPQLFKPAIETVTNHSFYTGNTIESLGDARLPVEDRGRNASEISKRLSKSGLGAVGLSPAKIDNLIQGYMAELGTFTTGMADKVVYAAEGKTPPATNLAKDPFFKSFLTDPNADKAVSDFYQLEQNANQVAQEFTQLKAQGKAEDIQSFIQDKEKMQQIGAAPALRRIGQSMTAIKKQINFVRENQAMSPEDRRDEINRLTAQYNRVAEQGVKLASSIGLPR
jgi:hypothetical protein